MDLNRFLVEINFEVAKCPGGTCGMSESVSPSAEIMRNAPPDAPSAQMNNSQPEVSVSAGARTIGIWP